MMTRKLILLFLCTLAFTVPSGASPQTPAITAVVDPATNRFHEMERQPTFIVVSVPRNPDPQKDRYTGDPANPIRPATAQEIADAAAAAALATDDALIVQQIDASRALRAVMISALWGRLGHQPTAPEVAAELTRVKAIYKAIK